MPFAAVCLGLPHVERFEVHREHVTIFVGGNADIMKAFDLCSIARKGGENETRFSQGRKRCEKGERRKY